MSEPSCSLPCGGSFVGGASSMCKEPSRLVVPILAVALAGRLTSPFRRMLSNACQPWRSILVTWPTVTSATRTREFGSMLLTSGICAWITKEPEPVPCVPGRGSEFSPRQPQPGIAATISDHHQVGRRAVPASPCHGPPPGGTIMPGRPSVGSVASGAVDAASGAGASAAKGTPGGGSAAGGT